MDVYLTLPLGEIVALLDELAPVRIHLTDGDEDRRWVELEQPTEVLLAPGLGVRVVSSGRIRYDIAGIAVPFAIRRVQILLVPKVLSDEQGQRRLVFDLSVEQADLEHIPGLVEGALVAKVNEALSPARLGTHWDFMRALSASSKLPERFEPLDSLLVGARAAEVSVTKEALGLRLSLGLAVSRHAARPSDASDRNP